MMKNTIHTLLFALVLAVVCSTLLVSAGLFTAPYRKANEKAEQVGNYLSALGVPLEEGTESTVLLEIFKATVREVDHNGLTLFEYWPEGASDKVSVAVPFSGPGVWGPIEGVAALEPDMQTIRGVRFFKQEETPGLGGEIASAWFQDQFKGRKIVSADGVPGFTVRKPGTTKEPNNVDAVTGATMTSDRVEIMLDAMAKKLGKE